MDKNGKKDRRGKFFQGETRAQDQPIHDGVDGHSHGHHYSRQVQLRLFVAVASFPPVGMKIRLADESRKITRIQGALDALEGKSVPQWLEIDKDSFSGTVKARLAREDITLPIQEQMIVELYSR